MNKTEASRPVERPRRVLLVEDEGAHRWVIRRLIENAFGEEVSVEEAVTGEKALERASADPPLDLILLDLGLPGSTGSRCFTVFGRMRGPSEFP